MGNDRTAAARACRRGTPATRGTLRITLLALFLLGGAAVTAAPARVASLNLCTDSLLFELLPDDRIVSVTALSRDDNLSHFHARAAHMAVNHGAVEEIVALRPDLVVTADNSDTLATHMLRQLGMQVLSLPSADTLAQYRANLRKLAQVLGEQARADELLAKLDGAVRAAPQADMRALVYQPNGYTPGRASLMHDLLEQAGLRNMATDIGLEYGGYLSLEALLMAQPDMIVFSQRRAARPSLAEAQLAQPALRKLFTRGGARTLRADIPENLWTCAGAFNSEALALLRGARP